jgi:hypothetical protein
VRTTQGLTMSEWEASWLRRSGALRKRDVVIEDRDRIVAWGRAYRLGGAHHVEVLAAPAAEECAAWALDSCLAALSGRRPVLSLSWSVDSRHSALLESRGFAEAGRFAGLVKQIAVPIRQPVLAPVGA